MKEIPIMFSKSMVQAILAGRKTMTRRVVKWPTVSEWHDWDYDPNSVIRPKGGKWWPHYNHMCFDRNVEGAVKCLYGKPGDILWVRETWFPAAINGDKILVGYDDKDPVNTRKFITEKVDFYWKQMDKGRMIPSIHMPKEVARLWLEVADVRVERLQDISEEDAKAEGVEMNRDGSWHDYLEPTRLCQDSAKASFQSLWLKINGTESWGSNPWVWVVTFKVLSNTGKPELR